MHIPSILTASCFATALAFSPASSQEVEIQLSNRVRIAFYEFAPREVRRPMRNAIREYCTAFVAEDSPWFCEQGKLAFFRAVNVLGYRSETGFVCREDDLPRDFQYFPEDIFTGVTCQWVFYDPKTVGYWVEEQ